MTVAERLVLKRQRHLKWRALDPLETVLMMLCANESHFVNGAVIQADDGFSV